MTGVSTTCAVVIFRVRSYNRTGCRNVSHCQQQWSYSGLCSPGPSYSTLSYAFSISTLLQAGKTFQEGVAGEQRKRKRGRKKFPERITDRALFSFSAKVVFFPHCPLIFFHFWYDMYVRFVQNSVLQAQNFCFAY